MDNEELVFESTIERDEQPTLVLRYYITCGKEAYGLAIEMDCAGRRRYAYASELTPSRQKIEELAKLLCIHQVTPCTLKDIVLDILSA